MSQALCMCHKITNYRTESSLPPEEQMQWQYISSSYRNYSKVATPASLLGVISSFPAHFPVAHHL